jgi:predicted ATPase/DNA-binding CsgD family transcriptional regulator
VGKTRLAIQVTRGMQATFPDGVYLVQLSSLSDPDLLASAVAAALGLAEQTAPARVEALLPFLRGKRLLLILDTCEHLIDACAEFTHALLRGSDGPRVLATSRQALDVSGEVVYPVMPLAVPDGGGDAVALFADRATAVVPGFTVTGENKAKAVALCRGLEGIPLAIELAAVRLHAMSLDELLASLGDRLRLLDGSRNDSADRETGADRQASADRRAGEERHQTLRAAIQWSYDLCSPAERLLWARLTVFAGEFGLDAAERVCGHGLTAAELVDALVMLVEKSVVIRVGGDERGARYRILDALGEFGAELLPDPGSGRRRHRDYYLATAREFRAAFLGIGQVGWVRQITDDLANFRLALECCLSSAADAEFGLELATSLWGFWMSANRLGEGRYWLARMLDRAPGRTALRVTALCMASRFKDVHGECDEDCPLLDEAQSIAAEIGDEAAMAWADGFTMQGRAQRGDLAGVTAQYADVLARNIRLGDVAVIGIFSYGKAVVHELCGEHADCVAECDRLLSRLPDGECWLRGWSLWRKGVALWRTGDRAGFAECLRAALPLRLRSGDMLGLAPCLEGLAWLAAGEGGDVVRTARLQGAADRMWRAVASAPRLGLADLDAEHDTARRRARQALGGQRYEREHAAGAELSTDGAVQYALSGGRPHSAGPRLAGTIPAVLGRSVLGRSVLGRSVLGRSVLENSVPGPDMPGPDGAAGGPWAPLTVRERQVAALVVEGLTNREIAARLVVSKRTIDAHVEHILAKLGLSSRVQVAACAPPAPHARWEAGRGRWPAVDA